MTIKYRVQRRGSLFYTQQHMFWLFWADLIMCGNEVMKFSNRSDAQEYIEKLKALDSLHDDKWCKYVK